jgi:hypothetical protein
MIAATINLCGAFAGEMSKRGRYCNDRIREEMVKPYLIRMGGDSEGHYPLPINLTLPLDWKSRVDEIINNEGYHGMEEQVWMYKDSRLCLTWPIWNNAYRNAKWIIVRRKTSDILNSCLKTGYMVRFANLEVQKAIGVNNEKDGWLWMVHEYEKRFVSMIQAGLNCKVIWPERMVEGDYQQIYELCDWLKLPWKEEALDFINPLLWGSNQKERKVL